MKPIKVLVVTSTFPRWPSDTEPSFVLELCQYLFNRGMQIDVLAPHCKDARENEDMDGIRVYRYKYFIGRWQHLAYQGGIMAKLRTNPLNYVQVPFFMLAQLFAVAIRMRSGKYDVVHCHWLIPQGLVCVLAKMVAGKNNQPALVCTSHGGDLFALKNGIFQFLKLFITEKIDELYVVSNAMRNYAVSLGITGEKISVKPMGVDLEERFTADGSVLRDGKKIIFVGRLVEKKGVEYLLDAFTQVIKSCPAVQLLIIGDGPLRQGLEIKSRTLKIENSVEFLGGVKSADLSKYYSSAGIAVVPSIITSSGDQEGLGLVIIEAMGCGCAVVASDLPAVRDIIDENTGVLVQPGDAIQLAEKLVFLIQNPEAREDIASSGNQRVKSLFSWDICGDRYYKALVAASRHSN